MSRLNNNLYNIDNQGHLKFSLRTQLTEDYGKPDSKWEHGMASVIIMVVCGVLDFVMFQQLFSSFLYDSVLVQMLSIIAMLIGFDLAPIYLGIVLKKRNQGINSGMIVAVLLGAAFTIAFIGNIVLRLAVKDMVLPDFSSSVTSTFGEVTETDTGSDLALLYALFASAMPVITSLVSFGVSYMSSDPLKMRLKKLMRDQIEIEDDIVEIEALLMEYESDPDHFERLLAEDEENYNNTLELIHEKTLFYCDYVRERLKEHLGDPTSTNELSKENRAGLLQMLDSVDRRYNETFEQDERRVS